MSECSSSAQRIRAIAVEHVAEVGYAVSSLARAYLGIVDSLHVELVHAAPAAAERRRRLLWAMCTREIDRSATPGVA